MLRFIDTNEVRHAPGKLISIHLMLRFIAPEDVSEDIIPDFNTSHVTVYLFLSVVPFLFVIDFNTSHVTVYHSNIYSC